MTGTTFSDDLYRSFYDGRALLASATGPLDPGQEQTLRDLRDDALFTWEAVIAASIIHYINEVITDQEAMGTSDYVFEDHAKHWSEMKGFALAFQFNRRSAINPAQFALLHANMGQAPVLEPAGTAALDAYRDALLDARAVLQTAYGFDSQDVEAW